MPAWYLQGVERIRELIPGHNPLALIRTPSFSFIHLSSLGQVVGLYSRFDVIVSFYGKGKGVGGTWGLGAAGLRIQVGVSGISGPGKLLHV